MVRYVLIFMEEMIVDMKENKIGSSLTNLAFSFNSISIPCFLPSYLNHFLMHTEFHPIQTPEYEHALFYRTLE